jgi:hypothetical protein
LIASVAVANASPTAPTTASWMSPTRPMPMTLPASSCTGRTAASSTSTTLVAFSSTTPIATVKQ